MTTATPQVPVSWGEVIDKMTILEIKSEKLTSAEALANVRTELALLAEVARDPLAQNSRLAELKAQLQTVNQALWDIEDDIREKEARQEFDEGFIALARSVYRQNDDRAAIKRRINDLLGSGIVEEKSYRSY
jgi:3-methyladenine DNA glycosylase/8-oxoguanine DNA glycosylase